jgi:hypothetical protein
MTVLSAVRSQPERVLKSRTISAYATNFSAELREAPERKTTNR